MFNTIVELSQKFMNNISGFASSIIDFLNYQFTIGEVTYTLFELLFTSGIVVVLGIAVGKFIIDLVIPN